MAGPACPVAPEDGTGVKFLSNDMLKLLHQGFQRKTSEADVSAFFVEDLTGELAGACI